MHLRARRRMPSSGSKVRIRTKTARSDPGQEPKVLNTMSRNVWPLAATLCSVLALGACSSSRFGSMGPSPVRPLPLRWLAPMPEPIEPVPSGPVVVGAAAAARRPGRGRSARLRCRAMSPPPRPISRPFRRKPAQPIAGPLRRSRRRRAARPRRDLDGARRVRRELPRPIVELAGPRPLPGLGRKLRQQGPFSSHAWDYRDGEDLSLPARRHGAARLRGSGGSLSTACSPNPARRSRSQVAG